MPISKDEFQGIDEDDTSRPDLSPETTQGAVYRFLLANADRAFRQREIVEAVDVPAGSVGPTLKRLEDHGLVAHRDRFWAIADDEHAAAAAGHHSAATADAVDGGFDDDAVAAWMENAVDPIDDRQQDATTNEE
ncbi:MarR family transcriptional regulator [Halonotius terrestris]|uniref:MarR family transcriptional regulator n=1 Tax=Halonotius terrestris TaxID=2487750 RepID=UPI00163B6D5E|nr:MarR family transcriptional regulator [Halonotius terrestris]